jgi:hypothetical protein
MWYQTLLVLVVICCLEAIVGEEDTVSPSTQYLIARAQCEAQCSWVSPVAHYIIKYVVIE